jgi:signal transduction histidine kinase
MNLNRLKLKWKIFFFLLGFCALLLFVLWLFQIVFLDAFYKRIKISEIRRSAVEIINNIENENIGEIITEISDNGNIIINMTDMDGRSLTRSVQADNRRRVEENAALIAKAADRGGEIYEYRTPSLEDRFRNNRENDRTRRRLPIRSLIYVKTAVKKSGGQFAVIIHAVISPVNATVTTLRYQLYFISCIILFLSVVLAVIIAKRVSKPIEEITQSAMILANGNYNTRFTGRGFYEIVALSETLNTAAVELSRVESLRRELLANISHDLRTPLSLIYSYAEMMRDFPREITADQIQTIMDETRRLTTLVNDILDISKLENEMEKLNTSRYNLTRSILETTETTEKLLKKEGFEILFSHNGDIYVDADKTKIDRAFYNLLINAVNYSGESRNILVAQTTAGKNVRIEIKDYGEGIAEADLPFIWDRYYKSGKTHRRAVTGSGLGLSIVKKIIEVHDGRYGVISEAGKGSIFWFEIGLPK